MDPYVNYSAGRAGLIGAVALVSIPMMFVSCFLVRTRKDPARRGFYGLHASWVMLFLASVMSLANGIMNTLYLAGYDIWISHDENSTSYREAMGSLGVWGSALWFLTTITLIVTIVELGLGLLKRFKTGAGDQRGRVGRFVMYPVVLVLVIMVLGYTGFWQRYYSYYYHQYVIGNGSVYQRIDAWQKVLMALQILLMVVYVVVVAFCIHLSVVARKVGDGKSVAGLLLSASILLLIQSAFEAAITIRAVVVPFSGNDSWFWSQPTEAIFSFWFTMVALFLIFAAGRKKVDGLWTTTQTFSIPVHQAHGNGGYAAYPTYPQQQPSGYGYGGVNGYRV